MRVLMLGWEYPPHISGGLGTACEGLTRALARVGTEIDFVIPRLFGDEPAEHMRMHDSSVPLPPLDVNGEGDERVGAAAAFGGGGSVGGATQLTSARRKRIAAALQTIPVHSFLQPYLTPDNFATVVNERLAARASRLLPGRLGHEPQLSGAPGAPGSHYSWDMFGEVSRYAANVAAIAAELDFDVIHAHDWMTYPAGIAAKRVSGKPLTVHVHSLEYDRSGAHANQRIKEIEGLGLHEADAVVAVSYYTRSIIRQEHGVPLEKIHVVHNGVYSKEVVQSYRRERGWPGRKVVLFLGRITFQKGPDYFVEAAARVIPHVPNALFVLAGSGDMLPQLLTRIRELKLEEHFHFPGFLKGSEVEEMFSMAEVYVMPSVSEPFGISALEAISFDTPVVISRQSGVSEVLHHALKVDFWDVERLADLIINALLHEDLRNDMVAMAREEVRRLRWDASALRTNELYRMLAPWAQ